MRSSAWTILVHFNTCDIFIIAIYRGDSRPASLYQTISPIREICWDFVCERNNVIRDGFDWDGRYIDITVKYFLCDATATVLLEVIISHTSYKSSEKCCVDGSHVAYKVFNGEIE